ncbi:hypothetical protein WICPIJ_001209 [Wickerhamomyces pijperi]|uniref:Uncharacterized protein n=1 Tax=Wickerhamomyces pijperi TaxID=599730 RepID=A0A9P8TRG9_WICPI|nr:hypothetical protein WICPIJ_001209 [Wickerhamomyces pijperi]
MNSTTIESIIKPMSAEQIVATLTKLQSSGVNVTSFDLPTILSGLNITQIEGLLASNATVVDGLLQSLKPAQLYTMIGNFQNLTSSALIYGSKTNNTALMQTTESTINLLMDKINNVFTDSQLLGLFSIMSDGAAPGTGSKKLVKICYEMLAGFLGGVLPASTIALPARLATLIGSTLGSMFGDYPTSKDIVPSAIFVGIFFIFALVHGYIWLKNRSRGHKFHHSLGLVFYSIMRVIGFALRIVWSKHGFALNVAIVSTIFVVVPTVLLPSLNLILAQRYFTWMHPSYGSHWLMYAFNDYLYFLVVIFVLMTIVASSVQINYFLSQKHYMMTKQVIEAAAVVVVIYSVCSVCLIAFSTFVPRTSKDKKIKTFQASWVKSFGFTYWVAKDAAKEAAEAVPEDMKHAIRVINSTVYNYETVNEEQEATEGHTSVLAHTPSIVIISFTTLLLFIADMFRCFATFKHQSKAHQSWIFEPVVMYVMYGAVETIVNLVYIFSRIDLRFYKPDVFKKAAIAPASDVDAEAASTSDASQPEKDESLVEEQEK